MNDPLKINVQIGGIDSSVPLLPEGDYQVQVVESTVEPNKDKTGLNWNMKLGLAGAATAIDGRPVNPNFPFFMVLALQAREDSKDPEAFKRSLCDAVDAIFGTDKTNRPDITLPTIQSAVGKLVMAQVILDEYQGVKNNKVRRLKKIA